VAIQLAYDLYGTSGAPAMVLLHALGNDRSTWDGVAVQLAENHHVVAPDLRGVGGSPWPGEYSFELMRDDVLALFEALDLHEVTLVGHSMGGTVACLVAEERPRRLARLVLEDTGPPRRPEAPRPVPARPDDPPAGFDWPLVQAVFGQLNEPDPAWWDRAGRISVPTLVIAGGPDSHVPQDLLVELAERIPGGRLVTIPAGHQVHRERPAEFIAALRDFLG
jgi:pimeloyl-ACP methyl ester carboxylesterase